MKKLLSALLIVAFFSTTCLGANTVSIRKFGGLNTRTNEYEISDSESPDMSNFVLDTAGSLTERNLFKKYNTSSFGANSVTSIYKFYKSSDSAYLIFTAGNRIYKASSSSVTDITTAGISVTSGSQWSFESFTDGTNELVFGVNNDCLMQSWNGTDATFSSESGANESPATNCNILKKHKSRLWASGSKSVPYRIYYSSLNNGDDWATSGGSFDLPAYEKIMALETLGDVLYVFTRTSIYAILGDTPNEFYITRTISKVGTHAKLSVALGGNLIYFLNKSGVFVFDGNDSTNISETIQPTVDAVSNTYIGYAAGLFDKRGRYWLSYTSTNGSYNDKILVYDTVLKQWYMIDGTNLSCFYRADGGNDKGELFAGCSDLIGYLWQLQLSSSLEQITHSTQAQLDSGVTFNTVTTSYPLLELRDANKSTKKADTLFLAYLDGVEGATAYTSDDASARVLTFNNHAQLDHTYRKFGNSALLLDGTDDYCTVPASADWSFGTGDFTLEAWVYHQGGGTALDVGDSFTTAAAWHWNIATTSMTFRVGPNIGSPYSAVVPCNLAQNKWHHVAITRSGGTFYYFADGALMYSDVYAGNIGINGTLFVGVNRWNGAYQTYYQGSIDEIRISSTAKWTTSFLPPTYCADGTLTSTPLQINASGQSNLGTITWQETVPTTGTDIQFTTRTGTTSDTVFFNGWQTWVSSSTVVESVTDNTITSWKSSDTTNFIAGPPFAAQPRNITFYETDDSVSPNTVMFSTILGGATGDSAYKTLPTKDLRNYKWLGYWLKAYTTGNSVELYLTTSGNTIGYTTANTVSGNTWEYHYWPITAYSSAELQYVNGVKIRYCDNSNSTVYLGEIYAYDFLDSGETITSNPNDFIQYKAILGSAILGNDDLMNTPALINANSYIITLSYTTTTGASETSLTSYWKSKKIDAQNDYNKLWQVVDFDLKSSNPTTNHTVAMDYWLNDEQKTQLTANVPVTGSNTRVRFYLPSGSYGRTFQFKVGDTDLDDNLKINTAYITYVQEGF